MSTNTVCQGAERERAFLGLLRISQRAAELPSVATPRNLRYDGPPPRGV